MLFSKGTGKIVGIIDTDPLDDTSYFCSSHRPLSTAAMAYRSLLDAWASPFDGSNNRYFVTPWTEVFEKCFVVCPD